MPSRASATRFSPAAISRCSRHAAAEVIFGCHAALHRLVRPIPGIDQLVESKGAADETDYHIPVMSLPGVFTTEIASIPPLPRFHVPEALPAEAARLLELARDRFKVGIVWSGSPTYSGNRRTGPWLSTGLPRPDSRKSPACSFTVCKKGPQEAELAACGAQGLVLGSIGPHLNDFADTASGAETARPRHHDRQFHRASGRLHRLPRVEPAGVPAPIGVYLLEREDSPWYPSMRLFRQPEPGAWDSVFEEELPRLNWKKPIGAQEVREMVLV